MLYSLFLCPSPPAPQVGTQFPCRVQTSSCDVFEAEYALAQKELENGWRSLSIHSVSVLGVFFTLFLSLKTQINVCFPLVLLV